MAKYKLVNDPYTKTTGCLKNEEGAAIPLDPSNADYQEYLKWVEEGNTPDPAD